MKQSDNPNLQVGTGLLQQLISHTVPIAMACDGLNIGGGHPFERTSKEKRVEEIKHSICTQNISVMS